MGDTPLFRGAGTGDLVCRCGASVLIQGYLPGNFLSIRIKCFHCGTVTSTPDLPHGAILPRSAVTIAANERPMVVTAGIARGDILVCQEATARHYALTRPVNPSDEPLLLSRALLDKVSGDYDALSGGRLIEHAAASPSAEAAEQGPYPFAWAMLRLRDRISRPGWSWRYQDDDAMAAMYVSVLHHLVQCWGRHPQFAQLAPLVERDCFIPTATRLAVAKLLFDAGNRVGFSLLGNEVDLHFATAMDEPLSLALLVPEALQWRQRDGRNPDVLREAVIHAMTSAQGKVNRNKPGIVVLAASILQPDFDQMVVDAIHAAFQSVGRRHRGIAGVAIVMPKVLPTGLPDQIGFGYAFYPIQNPRFAGENPIRLGPAGNT